MAIINSERKITSAHNNLYAPIGLVEIEIGKVLIALHIFTVCQSVMKNNVHVYFS